MTTETAQTSEIVKTAEQLASEFAINEAIPNEAPPQQVNESGEIVNEAPKLDEFSAVNSALSIVPIGLHIAGLKNAAGAWNEAAINGISSALVPVLKKYSFGQRMLAFLQSGGGIQEGVLIMALYPVAAATYSGYLVDMAERKAEVEAANGKQSAVTPLGSTFEFKV